MTGRSHPAGVWLSAAPSTLLGLLLAEVREQLQQSVRRLNLQRERLARDLRHVLFLDGVQKPLEGRVQLGGQLVHVDVHALHATAARPVSHRMRTLDGVLVAAEIGTHAHPIAASATPSPAGFPTPTCPRHSEDTHR